MKLAGALLPLLRRPRTESSEHTRKYPLASARGSPALR